MHPAPSLTRRLTVALVAVQWVTFMAAFAVLVYINNKGTLVASTGSNITSDFVREALVLDAEERPQVNPSHALDQFLDAHPSAWYVITDGLHTTSGGGNANARRPDRNELADALATVLRLTVDDAPLAVMTKHSGKTILVLTGGTHAKWVDVWIIAGMILRNIILPLSLPLLVGAAIVLVFVARRLLRSVNRAAQAAQRIAPNARGERLPTDDIPRELMPLVEAMNAALASLDQGYERYRRFVADAAHELRTPIAVLRTRLDDLAAGPLRSQLERDAQRISNIATRLLELERLQQTALNDETIDVVALTRAVAAEMAPLAVDKGYDLEVRAATPQSLVIADSGALSGAIANLLANAIAHGGGHGLIRIDISPQGLIDVSDEGPGVPESEAAAIFEPFHRSNPHGSGAGLGLSIVRETMRVHGGTVALLSPGGPGATFRLRFPLERRPVTPLPRRTPELRHASLEGHATGAVG